MYVLFILVAVAVGAGLIFRGSRRRGARTTRAGVAVLVATAPFFGLMSSGRRCCGFGTPDTRTASGRR